MSNPTSPSPCQNSFQSPFPKGKTFSQMVTAMELEQRISRIEFLAIRIVAAGLLILALGSLLLWGVFEFVKFGWRLWSGI
jgi:hypothetical protein